MILFHAIIHVFAVTMFYLISKWISTFSADPLPPRAQLRFVTHKIFILFVLKNLISFKNEFGSIKKYCHFQKQLMKSFTQNFLQPRSSPWMELSWRMDCI